jgi:hypothetical protein
MAEIGDEVIVPPGGSPPPAPAGTHWQVSNVIFSDTGGATVYTLVADSPDAGQWTSDLQQQFTKGFLDFFGSLGLTGGVPSGKAHRSVVFNGATSPWNLIWSPDDTYNITGFVSQSSVLITTDLAATNYAAKMAQSRVYPDVLFNLPASSSGWVAGGEMAIPVVLGTKYNVIGNVAGGITIFLALPVQ